MVSLIGSGILFLGMLGFGISTNIYADFLGISKTANDRLSFLLGIVLGVFAFLL